MNGQKKKKMSKTIEEESKEIEEGTEKIQEFLLSPSGIGILVVAAVVTFVIAVLLLNYVGEKALLYFCCVVGAGFFLVRELIGGKRLVKHKAD